MDMFCVKDISLLYIGMFCLFMCYLFVFNLFHVNCLLNVLGLFFFPSSLWLAGCSVPAVLADSMHLLIQHADAVGCLCYFKHCGRGEDLEAQAWDWDEGGGLQQHTEIPRVSGLHI